ncbi:hypothetical protein AMTRI_Chr08g210330 [Amborella trichopoda]
MEAVAEGLWGLADVHEKNGDLKAAVKCLEAICQCQVSFLPIIEVKTRIRIASILLNLTHNVKHAKSHLERAQLLLKQIPSCFELKCRAYSLLSQCYHLVGAVLPQKQMLIRGLELIASIGDGLSGQLWFCNFNIQLANALIIEGDYRGALCALERGQQCAVATGYIELQLVFATSVLHLHLMQWEDVNAVKRAVEKCDEVWASVPPHLRQPCIGLYLYSELLHAFYLLKVCDIKAVAQHVDKLDATLKDDYQHTSSGNGELHEQLMWRNKLGLAPAPLNGEWLPKSAVHVLVDLVAVISGRPKGLFKECGRRIQSGLRVVQEELEKLGIINNVREVDLQHWAIWKSGTYLMLLMHLLENKVIIELTRSEFVEAQEALILMKKWFMRFPIILQGCESTIEMLIGQYAHSLGCFNEAASHFIEATKLTESRSMQAMCQIYAAVSYICIGDAESSSKALDLIGPIYRAMDSYIGVREKTCVLFTYGLLLMKQHNLQEARIRLASGLRLTHQHLGNIQLVSQYLTILGSLALALHDSGQAREILKSSLTLAKTLYDIPTQIWVLSVLTELYQELGETANEMENSEYERKKADDLKKRISDAVSSVHHLDLIQTQVDKVKLEVQQLQELDIKRVQPASSLRTDLEIPESMDMLVQSSSASSKLSAERNRSRRKEKMHLP